MLPAVATECGKRGACMFRIGDFSRFSRVSVKMLRHYDEIGLLKPAAVDEATGYRLYLAAQLPRLNQILLLKDLGFTLDEIGSLLDAALTAEEIHGVLKVKRVEVQRRIEEESHRLTQIDLALEHLDAAQSLPEYPILVRTVTAQLALTLRARVGEGEIAHIFDRLEAHAARYRVRAASPPMLIYHDGEYSGDLLEVEAAVPVAETCPALDAMQVRELAGGEMACILYTGSYAAGDAHIQRYPAWLEAQGYEAAGPLRELYLRFGADGPGYSLPDAWLAETPAAYVTEIQLPVRQSSSHSQTKGDNE